MNIKKIILRNFLKCRLFFCKLRKEKIILMSKKESEKYRQCGQTHLLAKIADKNNAVLVVSNLQLREYLKIQFKDKYKNLEIVVPTYLIGRRNVKVVFDNSCEFNSVYRHIYVHDIISGILIKEDE